MRMLIWKEWHEQSWKLGFACVVLGAFALIGLHSRIIADQVIATTICTIGLTLLPVLASSGLVPAERNEGSLEALLALPIQPRLILGVKTLLGLAQVALPLLMAAGISIIVAPNREMYVSQTIDLYFRYIAGGLSLFVWMLVLTIYLPTETRAILLAIGVLIIWSVLTLGSINGAVPNWVYAFSPFAFVIDKRDGADAHVAIPLILPLLIQTPIAALLWIWASRHITVDTGAVD